MNLEKFRFHRLAEGELLHAYFWYKERSEEAAVKFKLSLDHSFFRIFDHSQRLPKLGETYQYVRVNDFPYTLIFRKIDFPDYQFFVYAMPHTSRKSSYWRSRRATD